MRTAVFVIAILSLEVVCAAQQNVMQGLRYDKPSYGLGETINFEYAIRNDDNKAINYSFTSGKQFDLWVMFDGRECFRLSKHIFYSQALTSLTLRPGQMQTYCAVWNQKDNSGKQMGPGTYTVNAQLTPTENQPTITSTRVQIGAKSAALVPVTIKQATTDFEAIKGSVMISARYRGFRPNASDSNTKNGPPVTSSDWAICDDTGCMYVTGQNPLDASKDRDTPITVYGKLKKTSAGQVYLVLQGVSTNKKPTSKPPSQPSI